MPRKRPLVIAWVIAGVVVAAGLVALFIGWMTPVAFGWFAYQPLANAAFVPGGSGTYVSSITLTGTVLLALGCIGLAFLAGWRLGADRRS
jgi:hypothetical protein